MPSRKVHGRARRVALVRNGVDYDHFAPAAGGLPTGTATGRVVAGYYGAIAHWFDAELLADLAELHPDWRFPLIGDTYSADLSRLIKCPNVDLLGEKPYAELPRWIADWDCCLIPFRCNALTEATNPVKVYEMLAAGKPVVAVDLPELRSMAAQGLIESANDAHEFSAKIHRLLGEDGPAKVAERQAFARQNTWTERYGQFKAAIGPL